MTVSLCSGKLSVREIAQKIVNQYQKIPPGTITNDVCSYLVQLSREMLIIARK